MAQDQDADRNSAVGHSIAGTWTRGDRIADFTLEAPLGSGRFADVWTALGPIKGGTLTLKLLSPAVLAEKSSENAGAVLREALRLQSILENHGITPVYSYNLGPSRPYYVASKLMTGGSLYDLLQHRVTLRMTEAVAIVKDVVEGLCAAHAAGLIHCGITTRNILFDSEGRAALSDFGFTEGVLGGAFLPKLPANSANHYLCPEGEPTWKASDIYSLGVILCEMLTGHPPFFGIPEAELQKAKLEQAPALLRPSVPGIPERMEKVVLRCLDANLDHRYADADSLRRALDWAISPGPAKETRSSPDPVQSASPPPLQVAPMPGTRKAVVLTMVLLVIFILSVIMLIHGGH